MTYFLNQISLKCRYFQATIANNKRGKTQTQQNQNRFSTKGHIIIIIPSGVRTFYLQTGRKKSTTGQKVAAADTPAEASRSVVPGSACASGSWARRGAPAAGKRVAPGWRPTPRRPCACTPWHAIQPWASPWCKGRLQRGCSGVSFELHAQGGGEIRFHPPCRDWLAIKEKAWSYNFILRGSLICSVSELAELFAS